MNIQTFLLERLLQINPWIGKAWDAEQAVNMVKALIPEEYIFRQTSNPVVGQDKAAVIIGPRQAGKTTFMVPIQLFIRQIAGKTRNKS